MINDRDQAAGISEQALLGAVIWRGADAGALLTLAEPTMFYRPGHAELASLLHAMHRESIAIEPTTVAARVVRQGSRSALGDRPDVYVMDLANWAAVGDPTWHAQQIRLAYAHRQLGVRAQQVADALRDGRGELDSAVLELSAALDTTHGTVRAIDPVKPLTARELLEYQPPERWRVPGLIGWREKIIYTGVGGVGKTELGAMLAVCAAAGLHPFTGEMHEPVRVLVVDLENELDALRRRYRRIVGAVELHTEFDRDLLMVESREQGMDVTRADDYAWLSRLIEAADPGILLIGPLYKLARGQDLNKEEVAVSMCSALDELRIRHDLATIIEAHPSKEKGSDGHPLATPRGSSVFLGWPSGGFGLRPVADQRDMETPTRLELRPFRRFRESRTWPAELLRHDGWAGHPVLPFQGLYAERRT